MWTAENADAGLMGPWLGGGIGEGCDGVDAVRDGVTGAVVCAIAGVATGAGLDVVTGAGWS